MCSAVVTCVHMGLTLLLKALHKCCLKQKNSLIMHKSIILPDKMYCRMIIGLLCTTTCSLLCQLLCLLQFNVTGYVSPMYYEYYTKLYMTMEK